MSAPQTPDSKAGKTGKKNEQTFKVVNKDHLFLYPNVVMNAFNAVIFAYRLGQADALYNALVALYRAMLPGWTNGIPDPADEYAKRKGLAAKGVRYGLRGQNSQEKIRRLRKSDEDIKREVADETFKSIMKSPEFEALVWRAKRIEMGGGDIDI